MIAIILGLIASALAQGTLPSTRVTTCGYFKAHVGGQNVRYCGTSCGERSAPAAQQPICPPQPGDAIDTQVRWGRSATSGNPYAQSGMGFTGETNKEVPLNREWFCGRLTHFNHPIIGPARSVQLVMQLRIPEFDVKQLFTFTLNIDETTNSEAQGPCPYPSTVPCSDKITFNTAGLDLKQKFTIGLVDYTLQLTGFKESRVSTSFPTEAFISNEKRENNAFLFARIVAACPERCPAGEVKLIVENGKKTCGCDCTGVSCTLPQELAKDCTCKCPPGTCNGLPTKPNSCDCDCPTQPINPKFACTTPGKKGWDSEKCQCKCDDGLCGPGTLVNDDLCTCNCASVTCQNGRVPNPNKQCQCECLVECGDNQIKVEDAGKCECACDPLKLQCAAGFTLEIDPANPKTCRCGCENVCGAGCGTSGGAKQCNEGPSEPCCQSCQFKPLSCDDGNKCTKNDKCDPVASIMAGKSVCKGEPVCTVFEDNCSFSKCDPATGACSTGQLADGSPCGPTGSDQSTWDLCTRECVAGKCVPKTVNCEAQRKAMGIVDVVDPKSCDEFSCDPKTGQCVAGPKENKACNDGNLCTTNDKCVAMGNGKIECQGTWNDCAGQPVQQCHTWECKPLIGECVAVPAKYNTPCGGDGTDACKTSGVCSGGVCLFKRNCERLPKDEAMCNTNECNPMSGKCQRTPRPDGSACILPNGRPREEDFCGGNYTCVGGTCSGDQRPETANHTECGGEVVVIDTGAGGDAALIAGLAAGAAVLVMILVAVLLCAFVNKSALTDPSTWGLGADTAVENSPLYDQSAAGTTNQLYEGN